MHILIVLTSHDKLGNTGEKTGFWLEELAAPFYTFKDHGCKITLASPKGGLPPLDPKSTLADFETDFTRRFNADPEAQRQLATTTPLKDIDITDYDGVFYPGGHGPLWDLAEDQDSIALIEKCLQQGKPTGLVCHAPGALRHTKNPDGTPLIKAKKVTGFSNSEEAAVELTDIVPFLVEDMLISQGGDFSKGADWAPYVAIDGKLLTGQNPASSAPLAEKMLALLNP